MSEAVQRPPLTRARVLAAAVELADAEGLSKLSMRSLARHLGFEVMALYNHVANKADLHVGMTDLVAQKIDRPSEGDWRQVVRSYAVAKKAVFDRHPWAPTLWISTMPGPARFDLMEWELAAFESADLTDEEAHHAFHAVTNHVLGYVLQGSMMPMSEEELPDVVDQVRAVLDTDRHRRVLAHIQQHLDDDHGGSFEYVLDLIIDGIGST